MTPLSVGDTGLEQNSVTSSEGNDLRGSQNQGAALSGAVDAQNVLIDPDLRTIIEAWPSLSKAVQASIVKLATGGK